MLSLPWMLILASQSPRRAALLRQIGLSFRVIPPKINEERIAPSEGDYSDYVLQLAMAKAQAVQAQLESSALILAADTIVVHRKSILNKPRDEYHAVAMLQQLSGETHTVFTGYVLLPVGLPLPSLQGYRATQVTFRQLDEQEIRQYVQTGSPLDKAGAYGIQDDFGAVFVERIEGDYYTVVGLPLAAVYQDLKRLAQYHAQQTAIAATS